MNNNIPEMTDNINVVGQNGNGTEGTEITTLLNQMKSLQKRIEEQKAETLKQYARQLQNALIELHKLQTTVDEMINNIKMLNPTMLELKEAGFDEQMLSRLLPTNKNRTRSTVVYNGVATTAAAVCRELGLDINGDSAVRVLQRYLRIHPDPNIQFL